MASASDHPSRLASACATVHLLALALWLAGVLASGLAAAVAFPTVKALAPRLTDYAGPSDQHFLVIAGSVARRVFLIADVVSFACATIASGTMILLVAVFREPRGRPATIVRALSLGVGVAALASLLLIVTPRLDAATAAHWQALRVNDAPQIALHKAGVDDIHPVASRLVSVMAGAVFIALAAGLWASVRPWSPSCGGGLNDEVPLLARKTRS